MVKNILDDELNCWGWEWRIWFGGIDGLGKVCYFICIFGRIGILVSRRFLRKLGIEIIVSVLREGSTGRFVGFIGGVGSVERDCNRCFVIELGISLSIGFGGKEKIVKVFIWFAFLWLFCCCVFWECLLLLEVGIMRWEGGRKVGGEDFCGCY